MTYNICLCHSFKLRFSLFFVAKKKLTVVICFVYSLLSFLYHSVFFYFCRHPWKLKVNNFMLQLDNITILEMLFLLLAVRSPEMN